MSRKVTTAIIDFLDNKNDLLSVTFSPLGTPTVAPTRNFKQPAPSSDRQMEKQVRTIGPFAHKESALC